MLEECVGSHGACRDAPLFLAQVREREAISSTATKLGAAFPHARSEAISRLLITALRPGCSLPSSEEIPPVALVFLLGIPRDSPAEYLESMALLSRKLKDPRVWEILTTTSDRQEFVRALTD